MAHPAVRGLKKSYSIGRKRLVSRQLRRCPGPLSTKSFQFFSYFKNSEFPLVLYVSEGGPEVGGSRKSVNCARVLRILSR